MQPFLITGLGNPGKQYEHSRHNVGFMTMDVLSRHFNAPIVQLKHNGLFAKVQLDHTLVYLLKPMTYMNRSGHCISQILQEFHIPLEQALIIYDDIALPIGTQRIRTKGSAGGHNGIKDIIHCQDSQVFHRLKIGVGEKPHPKIDLADWVLSDFSQKDMTLLAPIFENSIQIVTLFLTQQINKAMNEYNK